MTDHIDELTDDKRFEFSAEEIKRLELRWRSDIDLKLDRLDRRTLLIERLIYIASGAVIILAAVLGIASSLASRQSDRLDSLIERQAMESATNAARIKTLEAEIERLRNIVRH